MRSCLRNSESRQTSDFRQYARVFDILIRFRASASRSAYGNRFNRAVGSRELWSGNAADVAAMYVAIDCGYKTLKSRTNEHAWRPSVHQFSKVGYRTARWPLSAIGLMLPYFSHTPPTYPSHIFKVGDHRI